MSETGNRILCLNFNQSNTLLYIGTTQGLRVLRLEDSKIISRRDRLSSINFPGGFKYIAPLYDNQKIALIGTKSNQKFKENTLNIWDEYHANVIKTLEFTSEIKKVLVRREYLVVVMDTNVIVYNSSNWKTIGNYETGNNSNGAGAISLAGDLYLLVPGLNPGEVKLENTLLNTCICSSIHENPIVSLSLNHDATLGASCSEYGTVIRVFSCSDLTVLHELRRGTISARISYIIFSRDSGFLIAASNKSTVHIWNLDILASSKPSWFLPACLQYQRSYFKVHVKPELLWTSEETSQTGPSICITEENILYIAHLDGNIYSYEINYEPVVKNISTYMDFEEEFLEADREWTSLE